MLTYSQLVTQEHNYKRNFKQNATIICQGFACENVEYKMSIILISSWYVDIKEIDLMHADF